MAKFIDVDDIGAIPAQSSRLMDDEEGQPTVPEDPTAVLPDNEEAGPPVLPEVPEDPTGALPDDEEMGPPEQPAIPEDPTALLPDNEDMGPPEMPELPEDPTAVLGDLEEMGPPEMPEVPEDPTAFLPDNEPTVDQGMGGSDFQTPPSDFSDSPTTPTPGGDEPRLPGATDVSDSTTSSDVTSDTVNFNGKDPDTLFDALNSHEGWNRNKMGDFHLPTYKIRLFMTPDVPVKYGEHTDYSSLMDTIYGMNQTTIVESGVTGMNITSMEMSSHPGPTVVTRSVTTTQFVLNIHEPAGVNLLDTMTSTAKELGIRNYSKAGYFLELKFQGYTEDGQLETNIYRNEPNKGVWLYHIHITDIDVEVTSSGSNYKITAQMFEELFLDKDALKIPDTTMPEGSTLGEMLDDFADKLNKSVVAMYGYQLMTYEFKVKTFVHNDIVYDPREFATTSVKPHFQDRRSNSTQQEHGLIDGSVARGTMIHDAVEMMLSTCEKAQQLAKDVSATEVLDAGGEKRMRNAVVWRVRPVVEHTDYDFVTEKYVAKYTVVIMPYSSQVPVLTREQVVISKDPEVQKKNLTMLRSSGYLAKRYDYIFTGMNTEVLNFDLKLNLKWSNILPKVMGLNNSMPTQAAHDLYNDKKMTYDDYRSSVTKNQSRLSQISQELSDLRAAQTQLKHVADGVYDDAKGDLKKTMKEEAEARIASLPKESDLLAEQAKLTAETSKLRETVQAEGKRRIPEQDPNRTRVKYAEELQYEQKLTETSKPIPVSVTESNEDTRFFHSGVFPDSYHRDRAIMGAVMDQIYNVSGEEGLQVINLEVVGDPYWLGGGNVMKCMLLMGEDEKVEMQKKDGNDDIVGPNYEKGSIMFLLSFAYPLGVGDDGNPILKPHEHFTGVYQVLSINHIFSGGQYRQTINATRDKLMDVFKAFGIEQEPEVWTGGDE